MQRRGRSIEHRNPEQTGLSLNITTFISDITQIVNHLIHPTFLCDQHENTGDPIRSYSIATGGNENELCFCKACTFTGLYNVPTRRLKYQGAFGRPNWIAMIFWFHQVLNITVHQSRFRQRTFSAWVKRKCGYQVTAWCHNPFDFL
jgi:hypothetical protein